MEQSVLAPLQNNVLTSTSDFETFHCFETREKKMMKFLSGCLGYQKYWTPSCNIWGIRNSESPVLFGGSEFLNTFLCFGGSEILNHLYCLGDQKFWITWVVWGSEILNPPLCCLGGQKFWIYEFSPVFLGDQKLESSSVFYGEPLGTRNFKNLLVA